MVEKKNRDTRALGCWGCYVFTELREEVGGGDQPRVGAGYWATLAVDQDGARHPVWSVPAERRTMSEIDRKSARVVGGSGSKVAVAWVLGAQWAMSKMER